MMDEGRCFVIGDVHGCIEEVEILLNGLGPGSDDTVVFLGDYVDRGPDSKAVVDRLIRLEGEVGRCVFLKGNHEDMFLAFAGQPGHHGQAFLYNGGDATLRSYGLEGYVGPALWERLPDDHKLFFLRLVLHYRSGDFLCVHAGLNPARPLDGQSEEDLLWIRGEWIRASHNYGFTVLFGHTPMRMPFVHWPYKIGLDTGLVYGNALTCFETSERRFWQVRRGETQVREWIPNRVIPMP